MAYPNIPTVLRNHLAQRTMREHHHFWHLARRPGPLPPGLQPWELVELAKPQWQAPRKQGQPGGGIDFFGMHRAMIADVDVILATAGNAPWPKVTGWEPIPWASNDADWPLGAWPNGLPPAFVPWRSPAEATRLKNKVADEYRNTLKLGGTTLDKLGTRIENDIHNWMHMRWAAEPIVDTESVVPANDWLGAPFSSHVNPIFWKLHGWIDDCIKAWENANHATANLAAAWQGPTGHEGGHGHGPMASAPGGAAVGLRVPTIKGINWFGKFKAKAKKPVAKSVGATKTKSKKKKSGKG